MNNHWVCAVCGDRVSRQAQHVTLRVRRADGWDHTGCHTPAVQHAPNNTVEHSPPAPGVQLENPPEKTSQLNTVRRLPGWRPGFCLGIDGKWRPNTRTDTTDRDTRIAVLHKDGLSMREIAADTGCSVGTVHRVLRRWQP